MFPFGTVASQVAAGGVSVENTDSATDATAKTIFTFSNMSFGDEAGDRLILVYGNSQAGSAGVVSSVTIGGVAATLRFSNAQGSNAGFWAEASVPTGASGDVVVNWGGSKSNSGISVYRVTGVTFANKTEQAQTSPTTLLDITSFENGVVIAGGGADEGSSTYTWTGPTKDVELVYAGNSSLSTASMITPAAGTQTVVCAWSPVPGGGGYQAAALSYQPT